MTTERLIAELARQAGPVRVLPRLDTRWLHWAIASLASLAVGLVVFGVRSDAASQLASGDFLVRALLTAVIAGVAARHALRWGVPGAEPVAWARWWPQVAVVAWTGLLLSKLWGSLATQLGAVRWHPQCGWQIAALASVPAVWMFWQSRRASPYELGWVSIQSALAAAAVGALAVQWICGLNAAAHQLVWHVLPVIAVSIAVALAGRLTLRRQ
ncbi:MAG: NrsF family protein [Acidobacteriota bacterium]